MIALNNQSAFTFYQPLKFHPGFNSNKFSSNGSGDAAGGLSGLFQPVIGATSSSLITDSNLKKVETFLNTTRDGDIVTIAPGIRMRNNHEIPFTTKKNYYGADLMFKNYEGISANAGHKASRKGVLNYGWSREKANEADMHTTFRIMPNLVNQALAQFDEKHFKIEPRSRLVKKIQKLSNRYKTLINQQIREANTNSRSKLWHFLSSKTRPLEQAIHKLINEAKPELGNFT